MACPRPGPSRTTASSKRWRPRACRISRRSEPRPAAAEQGDGYGESRNDREQAAATERSRKFAPARDGRRGQRRHRQGDRKSVVLGKRVSVRVDLGGRRIIKKKKEHDNHSDSKSHKQ